MQRTSLVAILTCLLLAAPAFGQWLPDQRLTTRVNTNDNKQTSSCNAWCVAVAPPYVHVVWCDYREGTWRIYCQRSTDNGTTWGNDMNISDSAGSTKPSVVVAGSYVHVAWERGSTIYYNRSTDHGASWTESNRELTTSPNNSTGNPSVAAVGAYVYVVWYYRTPYPNLHGVHLRRSTDNGASWCDEALIGTEDGSQYIRKPSIAAKGAYVHVVRNQVVGTGQVYYTRSTDNGATWGSDMNVSNTSATATNFSIAVGSGNDVHVVWQVGIWTGQVYCTRSTDNGASWPGTGTPLTAGNSAYCPSVAVAGDSIHVVWYDNRDGNYEVYYQRSTDNGATWSGDVRLTNAAGRSWSSSAAAAGNAVHVAWQDDRDDPVNNRFEIYYKRNLTGNVAVAELGPHDQYGAFRVSPNPVADGVATVRIQGIKDSRNQVANVRVFDASGRCILTRPLGHLTTGSLSLDLRKVPAGVYLVRFDADGYSATQTLVVQCKNS